MAFYRQLLVLTVPSVAVLFGIYWYRRRRGCANSDPGGKSRTIKTLKLELEEAVANEAKLSPTNNCIVTPSKVIPKSAPIDIIPNGSHSNRTSPIRLSDRELDYEILKAKSQKFYEIEYPMKKANKENASSNERRVKSLPAKTTTTCSGKPQVVTSSQDIKREGISCLSEQILNCKIKEETMATEDNRLVDNSRVTCNGTATSLKEVIQDEVVTKKEDATLANECPTSKTNEKSIKSRKSRKSSSGGKENRSIVDSSDKKVNSNINNNINSNSNVDDKILQDSTKVNHNKISDSSNESSSCSESAVFPCQQVDGALHISLDKDAAAPIEDMEGRTADRDSANHSPVDTMLASPCISHFSDNHSEGSQDSGKGCSESPSPPPTNLGDPSSSSSSSDVFIRHQFLLPQNVVGLVIGNKKYFLNKMNEVSCAKVYIRAHPETTKMKICVIEGSQHDVDTVLDMVRQRLPEKRFPSVTLKDISQELSEKEFSMFSDCYYLNLVEGVNNDTIISCYVSPWQLFLQQPTHPTYPSLHILHSLMGSTYQDPSVPPLPQQVNEGMICAAPTANNWYRTQVMSVNSEQNTSLVKLVDFGGFMHVNNTLLKQIRSDFMMLPFQATEVQLADIAPIESEWSPEAVQVMAGLTSGQLLQAQVVGYNEVGVPLVYLYLTLGPQNIISLNQELVVRSLAQWMQQEAC